MVASLARTTHRNRSERAGRSVGSDQAPAANSLEGVALYPSARTLMLLAVCWSGAAAADDEPLGASRADSLLRSRTEARVLQTDDAADVICRDRRFTSAEIWREPVETRREPRIVERRWLEMWRLDRCGLEVAYWVFFTDLGAGGAYFSFEPVK